MADKPEKPAWKKFKAVPKTQNNWVFILIAAFILIGGPAAYLGGKSTDVGGDDGGNKPKPATAQYSAETLMSKGMTPPKTRWAGAGNKPPTATLTILFESGQIKLPANSEPDKVFGLTKKGSSYIWSALGTADGGPLYVTLTTKVNATGSAKTYSYDIGQARSGSMPPAPKGTTRTKVVVYAYKK